MAIWSVSQVYEWGTVNRLDQYTSDLVRLLERNHTLYPLIAETYAAATRRPVLRELTQTYFEAYSTAFTQIIEQGQAAGDLRADLNARESALALVALIEGSILLARNIGKPLCTRPMNSRCGPP